MSGNVIKVSGPLVLAEELENAKIAELVQVGEKRLAGEVLSFSDTGATIQMYEDTAGLGTGDAVLLSGGPLCAELGPGLLGNMFDGLLRPLTEMCEMAGHAVSGGIEIPTLSRAKFWEFVPSAEPGERVSQGDIIGSVRETEHFVHKIMVPAGVSGTVVSIQAGSYTVTDTVCLIKGDKGENHRLSLTQSSPVRKCRPFAKKHLPAQTLTTGQRALDTFFPLAKGGTAAVYGPAGAGKSVLLSQLAQSPEPDVVVYLVCGERGSQAAALYKTFSERVDPRSGRPLIERTVLIACTADMPLMARDAALWSAVTIAEYFRDMGLETLILADSITRWAEALREMSHLRGETPVEGDNPAYLAGYFAKFLESAGLVECLGKDARRGSLTIVGALSGEASGVLTQAAMRLVQAFWTLDASLSGERRFPALDMRDSRSSYAESLKKGVDTPEAKRFFAREKALELLNRERDLYLQAEAQGTAEPTDNDRLTLYTARALREDFLSQSALDEREKVTALAQQVQLLHLILDFDVLCRAALEQGAQLDVLLSIPACGEISAAKCLSPTAFQEVFPALCNRIKVQIADITAQIAAGGDTL